MHIDMYKVHPSFESSKNKENICESRFSPHSFIFKRNHQARWVFRTLMSLTAFFSLFSSLLFPQLSIHFRVYTLFFSFLCMVGFLFYSRGNCSH